MGCSRHSKLYVQHPELMKLKNGFDNLGLDENKVEELFYVFLDIGKDYSGSIIPLEMLTYLNIERTNFTEKAFLVFDHDKSGQIDFREFVISLYNYCTLNKQTLQHFAFELFDTDDSSELEVDEVIHMIKDVYGIKLNYFKKNYI
jgi:serine/threonine-protein phosphatase 2B regulatory subunit